MESLGDRVIEPLCVIHNWGIYKRSSPIFLDARSLTLKLHPSEVRERTKKFAIRIVRLFRSLLKSDDARTIGRQLLRSGTSVAANYRAVCRARSKAEFVAKIGVVVEEADETAG